MELTKEQMTSEYLTHELRAPLTAIRCALELILESYMPVFKEKDRNNLLIALRNTQRLNLLINDIMELSKIQSGRMQMFPTPCDPVAFVREAVEDLMPWVESKKLSLKLSVSGECPKILADTRRTSQALTNLLSNAIKFTPVGGSIAVSVEKGTRENAGYAVISVQDTGCGISPQDLRNIFRYFVQVGNSGQQKEGSGLGLSLARSMVEIQGGRMWVTSEVGKGTKFSFTIPVYIPKPELLDGDVLVKNAPVEGRGGLENQAVS